MDIYSRVRSESNPTYSRLATSNLQRQYSFLRSITEAAIASDHRELSEGLIKSLNHHAIAGLHAEAGQYRTKPSGTVDQSGKWVYRAPPADEVPDLMQELVASANSGWDAADPLRLASYCLWRVNFIHPFVNGNGRTARALCYFVLSLAMKMALPGQILLPELIRHHRPEYVEILGRVDQAANAGNVGDGLVDLVRFVGERLGEQLQQAP